MKDIERQNSICINLPTYETHYNLRCFFFYLLLSNAFVILASSLSETMMCNTRFLQWSWLTTVNDITGSHFDDVIGSVTLCCLSNIISVCVFRVNDFNIRVFALSVQNSTVLYRRSESSVII